MPGDEVEPYRGDPATLWWSGKVMKLEAENERLREHNHQRAQVHAATQAENERLRAALEILIERIRERRNRQHQRTRPRAGRTLHDALTAQQRAATGQYIGIEV